MRKLLGSVALALGLMAGSAQADVAKLYVGAGLADGTADLSNGGEKAFGTFNATIGLQFLDFIGVEFELGAASDDTGSIFSEPQVNYQAAMLRLGYRWDRAGVYLLGGQARIDFDSDLSNVDSGNAIGLGLNLFGNENTALNFHVLRLGESDFTTANIGFQYYYGGFR